MREHAEGAEAPLGGERQGHRGHRRLDGGRDGRGGQAQGRTGLSQAKGRLVEDFVMLTAIGGAIHR